MDVVRAKMMKNILIVSAVLAVASVSNAALLISVDGVVDPEDTTIWLMPSDHAVIDIWGDGQTPHNGFYLGVAASDLGVLNIDNAVIYYPGSKVEINWEDEAPIAEYLGINNPYVFILLTDPVVPPAVPAPLDGVLVDGIDFHMTDIYDVTLLLYDWDVNLMDTQVIHGVPEPATILLLGLGGLGLLRRRRNL